MGAAAYYRGNKAIIQQLARDLRPTEFALIDDLNALPKIEGATAPWGPIRFAYDAASNTWWALNPAKMWGGFGYYYSSLRQAVRSWNVDIVGYDAVTGHFDAEPRK